MVFCNKHRLPENHDCPFDLRKKGQDVNLPENRQLLYQDALEYMSNELTVAKIAAKDPAPDPVTSPVSVIV